jgi:TetR/AcrR family transcriptional regulator
MASTKKLKSAIVPPRRRVGRPPEGSAPAGVDSQISAKARILAAAANEFAAKGYAGARIDSIAQAAAANKQLVYYYFGSKQGVYKAVREKFVDATRSLSVNASTEFSERVMQFAHAALSPELAPLIRLNQWAALAGTGDETWLAMQDQEVLKSFIEPFERDRELGTIAPGLEPDLILLMLMAVTTYPRAYPRVVKAITGQDVSDPSFQRRFLDFMSSLASHLAPESGRQRP